MHMVGPFRLDQDLRRLPYVPQKEEFDDPDSLSARDRRATKVEAPSSPGSKVAQKSLAADAHDAGAASDL